MHAPKVIGLWNLHNALSSEKLDFFVAFSSIASICGNMGQANYAAANAFVDAFTKYRWSQGLPASVINLGAVGDIGCIPQAPGYLKAARAASLRLLNEKEVIESMQVAISRSKYSPSVELPSEHTQIIVGMSSSKPLSDPTVRCLWAKDARYSFYTHIEPKAEEVVQSSSLENELRKVLMEIQKYPEKLDEPQIEELLLKVIAIRLDPHLSEDATISQISSMAVDSLMLIETNGWLRRNLGLELAISDIVNAGNVGGLADVALKLFRTKYVDGR